MKRQSSDSFLLSAIQLSCTSSHAVSYPALFSFCYKPAIIDPATRLRSEYAPYRNHSFVSYSTFFCSGLSCRHSLLHLSLDLICTHWKQFKPKKIQILINHSITNSTCCHCASTSALFPITVSYRMASWNHFWWGFSEQWRVRCISRVMCQVFNGFIKDIAFRYCSPAIFIYVFS